MTHVETLSLVNERTLDMEVFTHGGERLLNLGISARPGNIGGSAQTYLTLEEATRLRDALNLALRRMRQ